MYSFGIMAYEIDYMVWNMSTLLCVISAEEIS